MQRPDVRKNLRRGVYIVPTLFTMLNIFFGFRSIVNSMRAREAMTAGRPDLAIAAFEIACVSLLIAAIFDTFDGMIARQLGATSEFGKEYDSLADVVTFGCRARRARVRVGAASARQTRRRHRVPFPRQRLAATGALQRDDGKDRLPLLRRIAEPRRRADDRGADLVRAGAGARPPLRASSSSILTACTAFAMVSPIRWRAQKGLNFRQGRSLMYIVVHCGDHRHRLRLAAAGRRRLRDFVPRLGAAVRLWSIAFPSRKADDVLQTAPQ